jgi:hypothetical protein
MVNVEMITASNSSLLQVDSRHITLCFSSGSYQLFVSISDFLELVGGREYVPPYSCTLRFTIVTILE